MAYEQENGTVAVHWFPLLHPLVLHANYFLLLLLLPLHRRDMAAARHRRCRSMLALASQARDRVAVDRRALLTERILRPERSMPTSHLFPARLIRHAGHFRFDSEG